MSTNRFTGPARIAGVLSFCVAAALSAQTPAPGTSSSSSSNRLSATTGATGGAASGATSGTSSSRAAGTSSNAMGSNNATGKAQANSVSSGDRKFMEKAAQGGMAEVQLGKLAAQKAQSAEVKQFGQRMVDDHSKANDQLKQIASSKGVNLPTEVERSTQRELDKLSKLSGAEFDREYMKLMLEEHKTDVQEFERQSKQGNDILLKSFAAKNLLILQQHLKMAQQIHDNMMKGKGS